jgi:hypothetical protein
MVEHPRLSLVMLVIAAATLATDVTRLLLELPPPNANHEPMPMQTTPARQEAPRQAPEVPAPNTVQQKVERPSVPRARGPPHGPREFGPSRARFPRSPPDFSINRPPWCVACHQPMRRYVDRRRLYE